MAQAAFSSFAARERFQGIEIVRDEIDLRLISRLRKSAEDEQIDVGHAQRFKNAGRSAGFLRRRQIRVVHLPNRVWYPSLLALEGAPEWSAL